LEIIEEVKWQHVDPDMLTRFLDLLNIYFGSVFYGYFLVLHLSFLHHKLSFYILPGMKESIS